MLGERVILEWASETNSASKNQKALGALRGFAAKLEKVGGADLPLDAP